MKNSRIDKLRSQLGSCDWQSNFVIQVITRLYVNVELIKTIKAVVMGIKDSDQQILVLLRFKKLIKQTPRSIDPNEFKWRHDECLLHLLEIEGEQKANDPLKWIDAEIEYLNTDQKHRTSITQTELLGMNDVMKIFKISRSTLYKRISEGMPRENFGGKPMFKIGKIEKWIADNS